MVRLTKLKCKNCGHHHPQYTSTREWEWAEKFGFVYTSACLDCVCTDYKAIEGLLEAL